MEKVFLQVCYLRAGDTGITQGKIVKNEKKKKKCKMNKISLVNVTDNKSCEESMEGKEEMENEEVYTMQVEGSLLVRFMMMMMKKEMTAMEATLWQELSWHTTHALTHFILKANSTVTHIFQTRELTTCPKLRCEGFRIQIQAA